jgi:hypothetical protein
MSSTAPKASLAMTGQFAGADSVANWPKFLPQHAKVAPEKA